MLNQQNRDPPGRHPSLSTSHFVKFGCGSVAVCYISPFDSTCHSFLGRAAWLATIVESTDWPIRVTVPPREPRTRTLGCCPAGTGDRPYGLGNNRRPSRVRVARSAPTLCFPHATVAYHRFTGKSTLSSEIGAPYEREPAASGPAYCTMMPQGPRTRSHDRCRCVIHRATGQREGLREGPEDQRSSSPNSRSATHGVARPLGPRELRAAPAYRRRAARQPQ